MSNNLPSTVYNKIPWKSILPFLHKKCKIKWRRQFYGKEMTHTTGQNIPSRKKKSSLTPKICNSILGPRMLPEHIIEGVICIIECVGIVMAIGGSARVWVQKKTYLSFQKRLFQISYISHKIDNVIRFCIFYAKMAKYFSVEFCSQQY